MGRVASSGLCVSGGLVKCPWAEPVTGSACSGFLTILVRWPVTGPVKPFASLATLMEWVVEASYSLALSGQPVELGPMLPCPCWPSLPYPVCLYHSLWAAPCLQLV